MSNLRFLKALIFLLFYLFFNVIHAQHGTFKIPDSLKNFDYTKLYNSYIKVYGDTLKSKTYLNAYLQKAIDENKPIQKALALNYLSYYSKSEKEKLELLNQSIALSENSENRGFLVLPYSFKGGYYLDKGKLNLALENYLLALKIAEKADNQEYIYIIKHNIGTIKADIGKNKEALQLFRECYLYKKSKGSNLEEDYYISALFLSEAYLRNEELDSAYPLIKEGLKNIKGNLTYLTPQFKLNEGIYYLKTGQLDLAKANFIKTITNLNANITEHKRSFLLANYYLGELYAIEKDYEKSELSFLKLDSIVQLENIAIPEIRPGYEYLVYFARRNYNNKDKQLEYINKLLMFDSIVNNNKGIIGDRLFKEFDTPQFLSQKERLISELTQDKKNVSLYLYLALALGIISMIVLTIQYKKRRVYQQKFNALISQNKLQEVPDVSSATFKPIEQLDLRQDIIEDILKKLERFEARHGYLKKSISRNSLAKELETNTKYLSKVINASKNKSFTNYINDLRIDYCINVLKENMKLRQYTIQGIAEEVGFNNAESFSTAFKKATGLKPSYFIKKLTKT